MLKTDENGYENNVVERMMERKRVKELKSGGVEEWKSGGVEKGRSRGVEE